MQKLKIEQEEVINFNQGNIIVSASAGSGKTFVMIERLIRLISEKKAGIKEILAVTFTEASARDMREKLRKAIQKKLAENYDEGLAQELLGIATADISTLHAFNLKLIRTYFFIAGVSPDFNIADDNKSEELKSLAIDKTFRFFYQSKEEWFDNLIDRYAKSRKDDKLKEIITRTYDVFSSEKDFCKSIEKFRDNYSKKGFLENLSLYKSFIDKNLNRIKDKLIKCYECFKNGGLDTALKFTEEVLKAVDNALSLDCFSLKEIVLPLRFNVGRNLPENAIFYKEELKDCFESLKGIVEEVKEVLTDINSGEKEYEKLLEDAENFLKVLYKFCEFYEQEKREENLLDFSDLEKYSLKILSSNEVASEIKNRYKYVFVDEYQDINEVQEEIIKRISNGNLFMVGDFKQSIYGFRGCKPEIFRDKFDFMEKNGEKVQRLNYNFRSSDKVIQGVNEIFSFSMNKENSGIDYKNESALKSGGIYPQDKNGRFNLHFLLKEKKEKKTEEPRIYDILEEIKKEKVFEDDQTASLITKIIYGELKQKYYSKEGELPVKFSDIAVLTRSRDNLYVSKIVSGLIRHGVPVTSSVNENLCDYREVQALINLLKLIDNFNQDVPLITSLKVFGKFTEDDFVDIVEFAIDKDKKFKYGGFCNAFTFYLLNANTDLQKRLKEFKDYLDELRFVSDFIGVKSTLEKALLKFGYKECVLSEFLGEKKLKRVQSFINLSEKNGNILTVKEFLKRIEKSPKSFCVSPSFDEDAVRVMTIHSSKGLEFPVVILCGLEKPFYDKEESYDVLLDKDLGFALKSFDDQKRTVKETLLRNLIREKMRENRESEELRIFYVATTRAKYSLHLLFCSDTDKRKEMFFGAKSFLDFVPKTLPCISYNSSDLEFINIKNTIRQVLIGSPDKEVMDSMKENFEFSYPYLKQVSLPLKSSVTESLSKDKNEYYKTVTVYKDESTDTDRGIIAHKILENYDFNSDISFDIQKEDMLKNGILNSEEIEKINLEGIKKALSSEVIKKLKGYDIFKEKEFIFLAEAKKVFDESYEDKILLQGVIDFLAVKENQAVIIDYKYSVKSKDRLKSYYKKQLDLYSYAVEEVLNLKVEERYLINILSGEIVKID